MDEELVKLPLGTELNRPLPEGTDMSTLQVQNAAPIDDSFPLFPCKYFAFLCLVRPKETTLNSGIHLHP